MEKESVKAIKLQPLLSPQFVAKSIHEGAKTPSTAKVESLCFFNGVTTDSRHIRPGCLFIAIKGENFDGHDFIPQAIQQGATGIIHRLECPVATTQKVHLFAVKDTQIAFRSLGASWRREFNIPVIAVAGSVGKTTTKEFLAAILQGKWPKVLKTKGSQNGFLGIPMTLMELTPEHGAAVVEIGIDEIGAMKKHMELVGATASLVTAIGPEHLEKLKDVPTVAQEEGFALSTVANSGGLVALNLDDPWIRPQVGVILNGKMIGYTLTAATGVKDVIRGQLSKDNKSLIINGLGIRELLLPLPLLGTHNAMNLLGAVAIACGLGLNKDEIQMGLQTFQGATGRSELQELPGKISAVCDYYNANPSSIEAGLELLTQIAHEDGKTRTRWVCLADMLELGPEEEIFHRGLAKKLLKLQIEHVLLYGPRMKALYSELQTKHFTGTLGHFESHAELAKTLSNQLKPEHTVLIKGSRGMKMEEVWKIIQNSLQGQK